MEVGLPLVLSGAVFLVSPMLGGLKTQMVARLFALLLQFLAFNLLMDKSSPLSSATAPTTPKVPTTTHPPDPRCSDDQVQVYKYYGLTTGVTMAGLLITMVIYALRQRERKIPPDHRYSFPVPVSTV